MLRCGVERKGFEHLLRRPFRRWMSCDVEVHDASSIVCEDNKNVEDFEPNGVDGEEVGGRELRNVILEERPPRLGSGFGASDHVLGNRSLRDVNVQLRQLAVDPGCAPNRVTGNRRCYEVGSALVSEYVEVVLTGGATR